MSIDMTPVRTIAVVVAVVSASALIFYCRHSLLGSAEEMRRRRRITRTRKEIPKPQRLFKLLLADNSPQPFVHLRRHGADSAAESHPFYEEITMVMKECKKVGLPASTKSSPPPMEGEPIWINTKDQLEDLVRLLSHECEFAVDTEQHSIRSFWGFTALLQVSTWTQDFLVDTIALHDEMSIMRDVFANPNICKVFHGADSDSLWLQRDFHIYIVNLFDTARACDILGKPQRSLAYLLQSYCGIVANKIFQRADWRLRPLPEEMIQYARTDAHYLLYMSDCLKNELLKDVSDIHGSSSAYEECIKRSNLICLQLYEKDVASPATVALSIISRQYFSSKAYSGSIDDKSREDERFRRTVHALCEWRDAIARAEDEGPRFILSDQSIFALAKEGSLQTKTILASIQNADEGVPTLDEAYYMTPLPSPSPVLLQNMNSLRSILQKTNMEITNDIQSYMESHQMKMHARSGSLFNIFNIFKSSKVVSETNEADAHAENKSRRVFTQQEEQRMRRRWKAGDFEASRQRFVKKFSCKAPVYHNCRIYAGDGRLLCFCDRKKLDWYVQRGLAEFIDGSPASIRLLFEPKGRPEDENNEFYIQSKTNCCVGCGESSHYLRYKIIPSCYRQHFPEHLKSHRSHDIVLLCVDCHEVAHRAAEKHKRQVSVDYNVPLFARRVAVSGDGRGFEAEVVDGAKKRGVSPLQLRTAATALLRHGAEMPKKRREELEAIVRIYYGGREISHEDIEAALLVGKGPRELRRLRKKKGAYIEKLLKKIEASSGEVNVTPSTRNSILQSRSDSSSSRLSIADGIYLQESMARGEVCSVECKNGTIENMNGTVIFTEKSLCMDISTVEDTDTTAYRDENIDDACIENGTLGENFLKEEAISVVVDNACSGQLEGKLETRSQAMLVVDMSTVRSGSIENTNATPRFTEEETLSMNLSSSQADTEYTVLKGSDDENETFEEDQYIENETSIMGEEPEEAALVAAKMQHHGNFFSIENRSQRISLLGHGPHGKKVVEMILQEEGEHGIARFCQRWRAVFVEALKPTHLPHGWDILHSGRREFGEYSVYNPSKKADTTNQ